MKYLYLLISLLCLAFVIPVPDNTELDKAYKKEAVDNICEAINDFYVFPDVAKETTEHLLKEFKKGSFDKDEDIESFSAHLTEVLQSVNHDKHMRVRPNPPRKSEADSQERMIEDQLAYINRSRANVAGFKTVERLEGNVAYLDYRGFADLRSARPIIDAYMKLIESADAVIIDMRENGGGSPETVQYLCSFFFNESVHLNSLYWRRGDETVEFWTLEDIGGKKMPDVPLFVLTSDYTFSGAEEFSYNMKTQKRATLIGETTGGGANPGGGFRVNPDMIIFIPTGTAINPITKTNWEGVGVEPDLKIDSEQAYDKAYSLAKEAAEKFRNKNDQKIGDLFTNLFSEIDKLALSTSVEKDVTSSDGVYKACKKCMENGILSEGEINMMGYDYLMKQQSKAALALFESNVKLHPESANVYDSFAEALASSGDMKAAQTYYEKAVAKAKEINDPQLELYQENLENINRNLSKE